MSHNNDTTFDAGVVVEEEAFVYELSGYDVAGAVIPKFSAALSILGSCCIVSEVIADLSIKGSRQNSNDNKTRSRILLAMGIADLLLSIPWLLTTWPSPKETFYVWGAMGTTATCTAQGFFFQIGYIATPFFNLSLALCSILVVRYGWTNRSLLRIEPWIHGTIWGVALICAIVPLPFEMYNNSWEICWISSYPLGCKESRDYGEDGDCTRGDNATVARNFFIFFPMIIAVIISTILMGMLYYTVRKIEARLSRYNISSSSGSSTNTTRERSSGSFFFRGASNANDSAQANNSNRRSREVATPQANNSNRRSREVATQAFSYISAYWICFIPVTIKQLIYNISGNYYLALDVIAHTFFALQGILNFMVFARKRRTMKTCYGKFLRSLVFVGCLQKGQQNTSGGRDTNKAVISNEAYAATGPNGSSKINDNHNRKSDDADREVMGKDDGTDDGDHNLDGNDSGEGNVGSDSIGQGTNKNVGGHSNKHDKNELESKKPNNEWHFSRLETNG